MTARVYDPIFDPFNITGLNWGSHCLNGLPSNSRTVVRELDNSFLGDKTYYAISLRMVMRVTETRNFEVFIEYGRTDGRAFNNSDMTFAYGERWGTLYNQTLMNRR